MSSLGPKQKSKPRAGINVDKQQTDFYESKLLPLARKSKKDFIREYKAYDNTRKREFYVQVLIGLEKTTQEGSVENFKKLQNIIEYISEVESPETLLDYSNNDSNPFNQTNLVILACKHNQIDILEYLFDKETRILNNLFVGIGKVPILPDNEDETQHNAFYYAIRSGNVKLVDALIGKWSDNYFAVHLDELDEYLSRAYEELMLKCVPLSEEIEIFAESKLIDLRFFKNKSGLKGNGEVTLSTIEQRIALVIENINLLRQEYLNSKEIDKRFLFIANFIAQNIYTLKRQLKYTYDRLPWEEIEFCLVCFVSSYVKREEINLFYQITLDKVKMLNYLGYFAEKLEKESANFKAMNIGTFTDLPKMTRDLAIQQIVGDCPQFKNVYNDYQKIRDIHSLQRICDHIRLGLSADPKHKNGQLVIIRVLQVIGECVKNTLESPKLSTATNELLLLTFPENARKIITVLRNSLSHAYSLAKKAKLEELKDDQFFIDIQSDIKQIGTVISNILHNSKMKAIRHILQDFIDNGNLNAVQVLRNVRNDKRFGTNEMSNEHERIEKLIDRLKSSVGELTDYEKKLFNKIDEIINLEKTTSLTNRSNYVMGIEFLRTLRNSQEIMPNDNNTIRGMKYMAMRTLENITPTIQPYTVKEIVLLVKALISSITSRKKYDSCNELRRIMYELFLFANFEMNNIKWIDELKEHLHAKGSLTPSVQNQSKTNTFIEKCNIQLGSKLSELKETLGDIEDFTSYKSNGKLQAVVEMLVLDIMSIKDISKNNVEFFDDYAPLLGGKDLRNHLAHDNALIYILLNDPSLSVYLNAKKLTIEGVIKKTKSIRGAKSSLRSGDLSKLKEKYKQSLSIITEQENMFIALEEGNLNDLKSCLDKGADINAKNIDSYSTLHFAAKGKSLDVVKYLFDLNLKANVKDINGRSPLHVAAQYGTKSIVEFFVKEVRLKVDEVDCNGRTPLHVAAAKGEKDVVEFLLKTKPSTTKITDMQNHTPFHYAVRNNHVDVVKILIKEEVDVDANETTGGLTSLHLAAELGYLELVDLLLQNGANANARNDDGNIPLHLAAGNDHLDVVNCLISNGSEVRARAVSGYSPLHYAVQNDHEMIANILLQHGAEVDPVDRFYYHTPLHSAAEGGYERIVELLLENKANPNLRTDRGHTPLHLASLMGHIKIVTTLLKHGVDIHAKDRNNRTALHNAARNGHKDIVELLIKNKAEVRARDISHSTPLYVSAIEGSVAVINILIKNGAKVNEKNIVGLTPLHGAALNGHMDAVAYLIENKAEVDSRDIEGCTPLCKAIVQDHKEVVQLLIKHKAQINYFDTMDRSPLCVAVEAGNKEIIEILIENGANVNAKDNNNATPLFLAVMNNHKQVVKVLLENEARVKVYGEGPLRAAVDAGYSDIVNILFQHKDDFDRDNVKIESLLCLAAGNGNKEIVNTLITEGADVNLVLEDMTPLHWAVQNGHKSVVKLLVSKAANVNSKCFKHVQVNVALDFKNDQNRTLLELAVANNNLGIVKILFSKSKKSDINVKAKGNWTLLHIAAKGGNIEMVKYLVSEGSDINAENDGGSKPIHIAAREGHKAIVEFFLNNGSNINDVGAHNQTLLHYAAMTCKLDVVKFLISSHNADVNIQDENGSTPLHIAAAFGLREVIEFLLKNNAAYNIVDKLSRKPLQVATNEDVINLLKSTGNLFRAVKNNSPSEVENCIKQGAFVNSHNTKNVTPLHFATWKGYTKIVEILLKNNANPNACINGGCTALHYAAKYSHIDIVKILLSNGAIYNALTDCHETPLDLAGQQDIIDILTLISKSFKGVQNDNIKVINTLNKLKDINIVKAIVNARNKENQTLVVAAMHNNFSRVKSLKEILQGDIASDVKAIKLLIIKEKYQEALLIYRVIFEKRKAILGPDNPGTLDIEKEIAMLLYKQQKYEEALKILQEIYKKLKNIFGTNNENTLNTRSLIALVFDRQGKSKEAIEIYDDVYKKQKEILGTSHEDVLRTQFDMAGVLGKLERYKEALAINNEVFEKLEKKYGVLHPCTLSSQYNIAVVLSKQEKHDEALKVYQQVYELRKVVLGPCHSDTLRTLHNIAAIYSRQNKRAEALQAYKELHVTQKSVLGPNHLDTLTTQCNLASLLLSQGKHIAALKNYQECIELRKAILGPNHPDNLAMLENINLINLRLKMEGNADLSDALKSFQEKMNIAAGNGDEATVHNLLNNGVNVNDKDTGGSTALHYAVNNGQTSVVKILLTNGADPIQATNEGNTPLHIAVLKEYKEIIEILLDHVGRDKLNNFVNAKTTNIGSTALHVAAKNGSLEIVKSLLNYGVVYESKNNEGKTPLDLSTDQSVSDLLKLVDELFKKIINGYANAISKLKALKPDELSAVTKARNNQEITLLQAAIFSQNKLITSQLLSILKTSN